MTACWWRSTGSYSAGGYLQSFAGGGYTTIDTRGGSGINGGIGRSQTGEPWSTLYVRGGRPARRCSRKANSLGGSTVMDVTDFGGAVTIAMFNDPDGLLIGLVRAPAEPSSARPAGAVAWFGRGSDLV